MKLKKEFFILTAVIIVLVGYLAFKNRNRSQYELPELARLEKHQISKLELNHSGKHIVLNKKDKAWAIAPHAFPADSAKIDAMLGVLDHMKVTALVSESKNYFRYDLSPEKMIRVKAWIGSSTGREIDIGKAAATFQHTYVKLPGDPHVYHARGNFRSEFDQTVDTLRDKLVLAVKAGDLHEIRITTEGQTTIIRKRPSEPAKTESKNKAGAAAPQHKAEWETDTGKTVDADRFAGFLNSFSQLNCDKYIDQKEKKDFQNPHYQLHFIGKKEHHLSLFGKSDPEAENYPGLSSASPYPFLLTSSRVDRIKEDVREMLQLPKPEPANPKEKSTDASQ